MKKLFWILFILYIAALLRLTVFRPETLLSPVWNMTLFADLFAILKKGTLWEFLYLFLGNIGWFVPFGILVPLLWKKCRFPSVLIFAFAFSLAIETTQLLFRKGVFEIDDLILNTFGAAIGYGLYCLWKSVKKHG